jgi:hypothetical protein
MYSHRDGSDQTESIGKHLRQQVTLHRWMKRLMAQALVGIVGEEPGGHRVTDPPQDTAGAFDLRPHVKAACLHAPGRDCHGNQASQRSVAMHGGAWHSAGEQTRTIWRHVSYVLIGERVKRPGCCAVM